MLTIVTIFLIIGCEKDEVEDEKNNIAYPEYGGYGINLLDSNVIDYSQGNTSMCVVLDENASLKVKIKGHPWWFDFIQVYALWEVSDWNDSEMSREFTSIVNDTLDVEIELVSGVNLEIFVYENGDTEPTWKKSFTVK